MHPEQEVAMRGLQSFLVANKEAILSLLQDMDRPEEERNRRRSASSHQDRSSGYSCSSPRSSQRSYNSKNTKQKERGSSRDSAHTRVESRRQRDYVVANSGDRSRSRSDSRTPPHSAKHLKQRRNREMRPFPSYTSTKNFKLSANNEPSDIATLSQSCSPPPFGRPNRFRDGRDDPRPCRCIGIFGMNTDTSERDLENIFGEFGEIDYIKIVRDHITGKSRGFGFVYYLRTRDAAAAKAELKDARIDGMRVRVDFSVTSATSGHRGVARRQKRMMVEASRYG